MEKQKTPEEYLEDAKKMIGKETGTVAAPLPVEYEPIRRYCMMVDDTNPLYLDPEYAKKTKYGDVILPPFASFGIMTSNTTSTLANALPPLPGPFVINMSQDWEFIKPIKAGDFLSSKARFSDIFIKRISIDPKAFWIVFETEISNQNGEVVCIFKNTLLSHRAPDAVAQDEETN